jgi:general secretion pathway protein A
MYESFYGLNKNPFNVSPDPQFLYLGENHREALAQLLYGVREKKGFIVITGEVGTGKTTLIHCLLSRFNGNSQTKTAFVFNPKLNAHDFIRYIIKDMGVEVNGGTKGDYLHALHRYLLEAYQRDERVVIIIDEAQGLAPELLEEVRLLSNFETSKSKLIQIVLVGQPELNKTLSRFEFRQLRQRINMRFHLPALSEKETQEYIERRLRVAGTEKPLFSKKATKEVYRRSRGIPRLINILCDNALLNGYALDQKRVDEKVVREAARDLKLGRRIPRIWIWFLSSICLVVGGVLLFIRLEQMGHSFPFYDELLRGFQYIQETLEKVSLYVTRILGW